MTRPVPGARPEVTIRGRTGGPARVNVAVTRQAVTVTGTARPAAVRVRAAPQPSLVAQRTGGPSAQAEVRRRASVTVTGRDRPGLQMWPGGTAGPPGPPGPASRWFVGEGAPQAPCGDWDFWLDITTGDVWACGAQVAAANGAGRFPIVALI